MSDVAATAEHGLEVLGFSLQLKQQLHEVRVISLRLLGRFEEAIAASEERIEFQPEAMMAWLDKAHIEVLAGDPEAAEATLREAVSQDGELDLEALAEGFRWRRLSIKGVGAYSQAEFDLNGAPRRFQNTAISGRLRLMYLF